MIDNLGALFIAVGLSVAAGKIADAIKKSKEKS